MRPPIIALACWLLTRPWPAWLQTRAIGHAGAYHSDGSICRDRWCLQQDKRRHW
jgi:hypothetical protein